MGVMSAHSLQHVHVISVGITDTFGTYSGFDFLYMISPKALLYADLYP